MVELSIVIPTYNEEKYLPHLLKAIKKQTFKDYEIIVSDNHSKDKTRVIAKQFGCKIVDGGLPGKARNNGAKVAKGKYIFFLDADVVFGPTYIEQMLKKLKEKKCVVATSWSFCFSREYLFASFFIFVFMNLSNFFIWISQIINPMAYGFSILVEKKYHEMVDGFNESIVFAEDVDYIRRVGKEGKFRIFFSPIIYPSIRRFVKKGIFKQMSILTNIGIKLFFKKLPTYDDYFENTYR